MLSKFQIIPKHASLWVIASETHPSDGCHCGVGICEIGFVYTESCMPLVMIPWLYDSVFKTQKLKLDHNNTVFYIKTKGILLKVETFQGFKIDDQLGQLLFYYFHFLKIKLSTCTIYYYYFTSLR